MLISSGKWLVVLKSKGLYITHGLNGNWCGNNKQINNTSIEDIDQNDFREMGKY